jgi:choline kinase
MNGVILAAGQGQRLRPFTDALPKTLLPVHGDRTILDVILANLAAVGLTHTTIVVGHAAGEIYARRSALEDAHGITLSFIDNDRPDWNNCYSLWLARDALAGGALMVNGDTVHPVQVEQTLLANRGPAVLLAIDPYRGRTEEAMKVQLAGGAVTTIDKSIPVSQSHGEYIGAAIIDKAGADGLIDALEQTWRGNPQLYYEDGFQTLVHAGGDVRAAILPELAWVEVDDPTDLARAQEIACHY